MAIILGTRGSQLALAQAELAKQAVERLPERPEAIIRITATTGDRRLDINLSQPGPRSGTYLAGETEGQPTAVNEIVREGKSRGVTYLTAVAGTAVLGVQFAILTPFMAVAARLWVFAVLLWTAASVSLKAV